MDNLFIADQRSTEPKAHVLGLLSQAAFEAGSLELATNAIDRAVAAGKESAWYWMLRGEIHGARGDTDISRDSYERAILLYAAEDSTQVDSKYHQATLHARLGYLYASQSEIVQSIGSFYNASGFYADLVTYSELLLQIHQELLATLLSQTFNMQLQWATVLSAAQLWNDAIEVFARLDSADGNWTPLARYSYGMVLRKSGEPKLALVQFRALPSSDLIPAKAYAETLYEAGQPAAARFEYTKIPTLFNLSETERDEIELRIEELSRP
jgi:tetratricopeptide (TPR) repeat protein